MKLIAIKTKQGVVCAGLEYEVTEADDDADDCLSAFGTQSYLIGTDAGLQMEPASTVLEYFGQLPARVDTSWVNKI